MNKGIKGLQLFFILLVTMSSYSVVDMPKNLAEAVGTGAWFTIFTAALLFAVPALCIAYLGTAFPGRILPEYSRQVVGKYISYLFSCVYTGYFAIVLALVTRGSAEVIRADFLPKTPVAVIVFMLLVTASFAASKGLTGLGRVFTFFGLVILPVALLIHTIMFFQGNLTNIKPLFEPGLSVIYLKGIGTLFVSYLGYETMTCIPFNGRQGLRTVAVSFILTALFYVLIVESCFYIMGLDDIVNYRDALIGATRRIEFTGLQFLRRIDILFIIVWQMAIFCTLSIVQFVLYRYSSTVIPALGSGNRIAVTTLAVFLLALVPKDINQVDKWFGFVGPYLGSLTAIGIPILLLVAAKVGKHGTKGR